MIRKMLHKFITWSVTGPSDIQKAIHNYSLNGKPICRVIMYQAFNGKFLEIHTPESDHVHSDFITEYMLVPDGEDLYTTVSTMLLSRAIK